MAAAISEGIHVDAQPVEHGDIEIRNRRLIGVANLPPGLQRSVSSARQNHRKIVMEVGIAVA